MPDAVPHTFKDLLERRVCAHLVTLNEDGSPQVTPVWFNYDGSHILVNSARGRKKDRNMRRDPRVALCILDPEDDFRYLELRGRVVEITEEGAVEHIRELAEKYLGADDYPWPRPGEVRVIYKIAPERSSRMS
ncbi:MAG: PPOX class F420-dependent oxidoreductase [Nitrospinota bacterium]